MNRDLKILLTEVEDKMKRPHQPVVNIRHWLKDVCRHKSGENSLLLSRIWKMLAGKEQLSVKAKDRIALLAGFQSWDDFKDAFYGDADAQINYEDEEYSSSSMKNDTTQ